MEQLWPTQHTFPKYMHIAVPHSNVADVEAIKNTRDQGMGGRIAERLSADFNSRIGALNKKIDAQTECFDEKIDGVASEMAELSALVRELSARLSDPNTEA
jgi:hypothetical protein